MGSTMRAKGRTDARVVSTRERLLRGGAALVLGGVMTLSALAVGRGGAVAQAAAVGTEAAAIAPANSVAYLGLSLDTTTAQWQTANDLLTKLGVEGGPESLIDSALQDTESGTVNTSALLGGEAAVIVTNLDAANQAGNLPEIAGGLDVGRVADSVLSGTPPTGEASAGTAGSGIVVAIAPPDVDAAEAVVAQVFDAEVRDAGVQASESTYNGTKITSHPGDEATGTSGAAYAVVGDFVLLGEAPVDFEPVIDTNAGTSDALSGVNAFKRADEALTGERLGFGFINGGTIDVDATSLQPEVAGLVDALSGVFGLDQSTGIAIVADSAGFRFNTVALPNDGSTEQPGGTAADLSMAERVPGDALVFANGFGIGRASLLQGLGLYLAGLFNSMSSSTFGKQTPAATPTPDELFAQVEQLLGFNLDTGLISQLVGEYGFAVWNVDPNDPAQIGALLASDVENPALLSDSLSKVSLLVQAAAQGSANVTTQTIGDSAVSVVTIGDGNSGTPLTIDYGVVGDQFLLGLNDSITQYTGGFSDTLADSPGYQAALAKLPQEYDGIYYVDLQQAAALSSSSSSAFGWSGYPDNGERCSEFATQAEAQAAYDEDTVANYDLDTDFDGQACEDAFAASTAAATPTGAAGFSALRSFATVSYKQDGLAYTSSILLIGEQ